MNYQGEENDSNHQINNEHLKVQKLTQSESCKYFEHSNVFIFNQRRASFKKMKTRKHIRKSSISGKMINLCGVPQGSPLKSPEKEGRLLQKQYDETQLANYHFDNNHIPSIERKK